MAECVLKCQHAKTLISSPIRLISTCPTLKRWSPLPSDWYQPALPDHGCLWPQASEHEADPLSVRGHRVRSDPPHRGPLPEGHAGRGSVQEWHRRGAPGRRNDPDAKGECNKDALFTWLTFFFKIYFWALIDSLSEEWDRKWEGEEAGSGQEKWHQAGIEPVSSMGIKPECGRGYWLRHSAPLLDLLLHM